MMCTVAPKREKRWVKKKEGWSSGGLIKIRHLGTIRTPDVQKTRSKEAIKRKKNKKRANNERKKGGREKGEGKAERRRRKWTRRSMRPDPRIGLVCLSYGVILCLLFRDIVQYLSQIQKK
jgi:hypothetical protein